MTGRFTKMKEQRWLSIPRLDHPTQRTVQVTHQSLNRYHHELIVVRREDQKELKSEGRWAIKKLETKHSRHIMTDITRQLGGNSGSRLRQEPSRLNTRGETLYVTTVASAPRATSTTLTTGEG